MAAGKIAEFKDRGFGFIRPDTGGRDLFFHIQQWAGPGLPQPDARVTYQLQDVPGRGQQAVGVTPEAAPAPEEAPLEFSDVLTEGEFLAEVGGVLLPLARRRGWVE